MRNVRRRGWLYSCLDRSHVFLEELLLVLQQHEKPRRQRKREESTVLGSRSAGVELESWLSCALHTSK